MMSLSRFTILLIVSLLLTVPLFAQDSIVQPTATIGGHVYAPDGVTPLAGVKVSLDFSFPPSTIAYTDAHGFYQFTVTPGVYRLSATLVNYPSTGYVNTFGESNVIAAPYEQRLDIDIFFIGSSTISGTVFAPDGNHTNARLLLYEQRVNYTDARINYWLRVEGQTDANGNFTLHVPDGTYLLRVASPTYPYEYYPDKFTQRDAQRLVIANGGSISGLQILLDNNAWITGQVTYTDGTPVDHAVVRIRESGSNVWAGETLTDSSGVYSLAAFASTFDVYAFTEEHSNVFYTGGTTGVMPVTVAAGQVVSGIDIQFWEQPLGTISGRVTLSDGAPLTAQPLSAYADLLTIRDDLDLTEEEAAEYQQHLTDQLQTALGEAEEVYGFVIVYLPWGGYFPYPLQADGSYSIRTFADDLRVQAVVVGYAPEFYGGVTYLDAATFVPVAVNAVVTGIDITVDLAGTISGIVRDANGAPLPFAHVDWVASGIGYNASGCTGTDGTYLLTGIPLDVPAAVVARAHSLCGTIVRHNGVSQYWHDSFTYEGATLITATAATPNVTGIDFTLPQGGTISGRITRADTGEPITNAGIFVPEFYERTTGYSPWATSDENGYYTVTGFPINIPVLIYSKMTLFNEATYPEPLTLASGEVRTGIDFALTPSSAFATQTTPVLVVPTGASVINPPTFMWNRAASAQWYYVWISGQNGRMYDGWHEWITICEYECSVAPLIDALPPGHYTWWVQAWSPNFGYGAWSAPKDFNVPYSAAPTPTAPIGAVSESSATFAWTGLPNVLWYQVWISTPDGSGIERWYNAFDICAANVCAAPDPLDLNAGIYTWWVRGWNYGLYTPWSAATYFALPLPAPTQVAPSGTISAPPLFTWNALPGADWYYLWLSDANGTVMHEWYDAASHCAGLTCTLTLPVTWHEGGYTWWLQAWSPVTGYSEWSPGTGFAYDDPLVPITAPEVVPPTPIPPEEQPPAPDLPPVPDLPPDAPPSDF